MASEKSARSSRKVRGPIHLLLPLLLLIQIFLSSVVHGETAQASPLLPNSNRNASTCDNIEILNKFLETNGHKPFFVQGWRWHTLSLVRDSRRLEKLALRLEKLQHDDIDDKSLLSKAAGFVIDFNMKGLHRIEDDLFFPWLKTKLTLDGAPADKNDDAAIISNELQSILVDIEQDRRYVAKLGRAVKEQALVASTNPDPVKRSAATSNVAQMTAALTSSTKGIMDKEEKFIVPAVAAIVSSKEQKSFNNKVLMKLGLLDSRVHLVGMYDAVWEKKDERERALFNEAIPYVPRIMIPRWRRNLYDPLAGALDQ